MKNKEIAQDKPDPVEVHCWRRSFSPTDLTPQLSPPLYFTTR